MYRVFQKNLQWFTFLPRIWLMAALSLSVHSATTLGRISCNTTRSAPPPATSLYHLHVQHKSIERFLDMRFLLVFVLMQPRLQFDLNVRHITHCTVASNPPPPYLVYKRESSHAGWWRQWRWPEPAACEEARGGEARYCTEIRQLFVMLQWNLTVYTPIHFINNNSIFSNPN